MKTFFQNSLLMAKSIADILAETRASKGFNKSEMARQLGIASQLYGQYERGEVEPKTEFRDSFEEKFSISLKTGEPIAEKDESDDLAAGIKLSDDKETIYFGKQTYFRMNPEEYAGAFKGWHGVPMYNVPVTASFVQTYRDTNEMNPQYYLHDPRFKDCSFGAIITGDSMYPEIRHGDFVVCQEITDKRFIVFGDIYYVVSSNGLETCKYINKDPEDRSNYLLVPRNNSIDPSPIPKEMIDRLFKVRGVVRGY